MEPSEESQGKLARIWRPFRQELAVRLDRLLHEFEAAWKDMASSAGQLRSACQAQESGEWLPDRMDALAGFFEGAARPLLVEPVRTRLRGRPQLRALSAIESFNEAVEDVVRQLPVKIVVSGAELAGAVGGEAGGRVRKRWLRARKGERALPLRRIVSAHLLEETLRRAPVDGAFQLALSRASLHLLDPWQALREQVLRVLAGEAEEVRRPAKRRERRLREAGQDAARAERLLDQYRKWGEGVPSRLDTRLLKCKPAFSQAAGRTKTEKHQRYFAYWARQQRGVQALLELEVDLSRVAGAAARAGQATLASLNDEHEELLGELDSVIGWLQSSMGGEPESGFPAPQAKLVSAEDRIAVWARQISAAGRSQLTVTMEACEPRAALPGWRSPWSQLQPEQAFLRALESTGRRMAIEGFREAEASHRAIVREIERAREVVSYGLEAARTEGDNSVEVARQGITNALELLRFQREHAPEVASGAEASLARATAAVLRECYITLEKGRLGLLAHVAREASDRGTRQLWLLSLRGLRAGLVRSWQELRRFGNWLLYRTGLKTPPLPPTPPVARTGRLGQILEVQLGVRSLPMIYRRLFRLAPVEDPRFLVGRDAEMAGLAEARQQWQAGSAVSILVVGARGSGKTSLLNCAELLIFAGSQVVRGQFRDRTVSEEQMHAFLRGLLGIPAEVDLLEALTQQRRVIMIEELERTFIRRMNGFEALHALLELISQSWRSTLWVLSLNETAFRYLNAAVGFGRFFSYRINAMSVRQEDLQSAILLRHNLSGYRLEFAPPPEGDPRVSRLRRTLGLQQDPQQLFFESLYRQSEGIFRSAFELWQHYIERVEGGVLHVRQPVDPDYEPLIVVLTAEDYFTLQAILQHGGLTSAAHAEIFGESEDVSRSRLERLKALEILEPDPGAPGLRVRPEAGRLVREALHRQNLQ